MTKFRIPAAALLLPILLVLPAGTRLAAQNQPLPNPLIPYGHCEFPDGLRIVQSSPLAAGATSRQVDTDNGPRTIDLYDSRRILLAYPGTDFFANVKVEWLVPKHYAASKRALLANFKLLARKKAVNTSLPSPFHGFEAHGVDRKDLDGGVLGFYLLFDDSAHVVATVDMLNQDPSERKFQTMQQYAELRDRFLNNYASCVRSNQKRQGR